MRKEDISGSRRKTHGLTYLNGEPLSSGFSTKGFLISAFEVLQRERQRRERERERINAARKTIAQYQYG